MNTYKPILILIFSLFIFFFISKLKRHPEQAADEVFFTNLTNEDDTSNIGWKDIRFGKIAYDKYGNETGRYPKVFPAFTKRKEVEKALKESRWKDDRKRFRKMLY